MAKMASYSEVDAMRDVDAALGKLQPEAQQRVVDWVTAKYELSGGKRPPVENSVSLGQVSAGGPVSMTSAPKDIKSFLAQKRPESFYERVACLVYFLEKFEGKTEVGTKEIKKANSDARLSKLTNPAVFVKHATHTYGYLTSLGKRAFAISMRGEAVVDALPDRTKVEEAHTKFPFGRKGARKSKKKTGRAK